MAKERYVLATGEEGAYRLSMVDAVHGADTRAFLNRLAVPDSALIADVGCGVGVVSCMLAQEYVPNGQVVGVDISPAQVTAARQRAERAGIANAHFVAARAYQTGLERSAFDVVYSRFMLMHLQNPADALREMASLLRPGGILAVEDGDFTTPFCWPPCPAFTRCFALYRALGELHREDFLIGQKLYALVCTLGLETVQVTLAQPIFTQGAAKRLPELTLVEAAPVFIEAGLATQEEIDALASEMEAYSADPTTVIGMARMMQVAARKRAD